MRLFAIMDGSRRKAEPCAFLVYTEKTREFEIVIRQDVDPDSLPQSLTSFARQGVYTLDNEQSMAFVAERLVPTDRQSLEEVLIEHGFDEHDPFPLLEEDLGRCARDDFCLREIAITVREQRAVREGDAEELNEAFRGARDETRRQVGALVAGERKRLGWSQQKLADRAGVQQAVISRLESGRTNPTVELLSAVAQAMGKRLVISME